jgi:DNA (cytosine-5)-methyltransferase 1
MDAAQKPSLKFIDLFAGIGGLRLPFDELGGDCVFASEWEKNAQQTYLANFGHPPVGDITQIPSADIPEHDLLLAGFPCQPFSIIGEKRGFADTRGTLFFEIERILQDKQPRAFLLENVKQLVSHDRGRTLQVILKHLEGLGYRVTWKVLNALDFGLPQKRERVFIVGFLGDMAFEFPRPSHKPAALNHILESDEGLDSKWFASDYIQKKRLAAVSHKSIFYPSIWHENKAGNISILPYSCALRAGASFNYLLVNGKRRLTPREMLRLQGFPESFHILGTESQIRQQIGNSVPVAVVREIAKAMIQVLAGETQAAYEHHEQLPLLVG